MNTSLFCLRPAALACVCACACSALTSSLSFAQTAAPDTSLEPVVVSASREGTSKRKTPAAIDLIKRSTLQDKKAAFIGELLNQAAGVYMPDYRNEQHAMSIRHPLTTNAVYLYMEDGLPVRPPGLFNHNALYELNLEGIDHIEVLRGPASSLYGSNAVGGAVNFFSRSALGRAGGHLGTQISDQGYRRLDFAAHTGAMGPEDHQQGLNVDGYVARKRGGDDSYNDADKQSISLRHDWVLAVNTNLKTTLTSNHLDTDMPGSLTPDQYVNNPGFSPQTFTDRQVHATRLATTLDGQWNEGGATAVTLFARDNITNQIPSYRVRNINAGTASGFITNQSFRSLGLEARHRQDMSIASQPVRWINGYLFDDSPMKAFDQNLSITRDGSGRYVSYAQGSVARDYAVDVQTQAVYSQVEWQPSSQISLVAGVRHDRIAYDYVNHLTPGSSTGAPSEQRHYQHTSPKLGATWHPARALTVFGNVSQGFTPPEVSAQYGSSAVAPTLRPATFNNLDTGVRWSDPSAGFKGELALYQLDGRDEILSYTIAPGQSESRNAGRTRHRGLEFSAQQRWHDVSVGLAGSYSKHSYQDYVVSSSLDYSGKEIKAAPRLLANIELGYQALPELKLTAIVQHLDRYWMNDANTVRYGGHDLLNLQAKWTQRQWEWWIKLNNATGKKYAESAASSYNGLSSTVYAPATMDSYTVGQPRTLLVGVRYSFNALQGGL
ncbi:MAG: TonB-dependent receptor [Aquabacterium sp.]|nr:TonB-dependent receptor [Aquabacterium sp.]